MPTSSYNVTRLLAELGLKNIIEMPVSSTIQPTLSLDSMAGQVPLHQSAVSMFGGDAPSVVGEHAGIQIKSLDPGGVVLEWFEQTNPVAMIMQMMSGTPIAWDTGPTLLPSQTFGEAPVQSTVEFGYTIGIPPSNTPRVLGILRPRWGKLLIPRGSFFVIRNIAANFPISFGLQLTAVAATESEPS